MKKNLASGLMAALFLSASVPSSAQSNLANTLRVNLESGLLIPLASSISNLKVGFPYTSLDDNGTRVQNEFTGSPGNAFSNVRGYVGAGFEYGNGNHFFSAKVDGSPTVHPEGLFILAAGYGYNWSISNNGVESASDANTYFNVSTSVSLVLLNRTESLGSIDNNEQTLTVFGKDIPADYKASYGGSPSSYHAYAFDVLYSHTNYGLMPQIAIVTNPNRTLLSLEFDISCFLPILKSSGTLLYWQSGSTDFKKAANSGFNENGVALTAGNTVYTQSPLSLASLQVGVKLGFQVRGKKAHA